MKVLLAFAIYLVPAIALGQGVCDTQCNFQTCPSCLPRTIKQKLNDFVSVKDFSAQCDGMTDDSAPMQLAYNSSAISVPPFKIVIPPNCLGILIGSYTITAATWSSLGGGTATITTSQPHNFLAGNLVNIAGMTPTAWNFQPLTIASVTSTQFTFATSSNPGTATVFGTVSMARAIVPLDDQRITPGNASGAISNGAATEYSNQLYLPRNMTAAPIHTPIQNGIFTPWDEVQVLVDMTSNVAGPTNYHLPLVVRSANMSSLGLTTLMSAITTVSPVGTNDPVTFSVVNTRVFENNSYVNATIDEAHTQTFLWQPNTVYGIPGQTYIAFGGGPCNAGCLYGLVSGGLNSGATPPICSTPVGVTCTDAGGNTWRYINGGTSPNMPAFNNTIQESVAVTILNDTQARATFNFTHPAGTVMFTGNRGGYSGISVQVNDTASNTNWIFAMNPNVIAYSPAQGMTYEGAEFDMTNLTGKDAVDFAVGFPVQQPNATAPAVGGYLVGETQYCGGNNDCSAAIAISTAGGGEWRNGININSVRRRGIAITNGGGGAPINGITIEAAGTYGIVVGSNQPLGAAENPGYLQLDPSQAAILLTSQGGCAACTPNTAPVAAASNAIRFQDRVASVNHATDMYTGTGGGVSLNRDGAYRGSLFAGQHQRFGATMGTGAGPGAIMGTLYTWHVPFATATISSFTCVGTTVSVTTASPHGLFASNGASVFIAGVSPAGYSGTFVLATTPDNTHFTFPIGACLGVATLTSATAGDVNYSVTCTLAGRLTGVPVVVSTSAKTPLGFTLNITNVTVASASATEADCMALRDND